MFDGEAGFTRRLSSLGADEPSLLAFAHQDGINSGDERMLRLIAATSRCPFRARDGVLLNVECFGPAYKGDDDQDDDDRSGSGNVDSSQNSDTPYNHNVHRRSTHNSDQWPLLLYVHGICESAETWGVQTLVQYCAKHCWRLLVLELAGHGLSDDVGGGVNGKKCRVGSTPGMGRATCPDFDELVNHVAEFTVRMGHRFSRAKGMVLCGGSMGGALVAYAVKDILAMRRDQSNNTSADGPRTAEAETELPDFYGIALLAPALGVRPDALPPAPVVVALRGLSYLFPSRGILTPIEHPTYACPPSSIRNFSGHWPLSTSNMLLDLTSRRVPNDVDSGEVQRQMKGLKSLCVITGDKDEMIPLAMVTKWFDAVSHLRSDNGEKTMVVLKGGRHGFFHERTREGMDRKRAKKLFVDSLFKWLNELARKDFE